MAPSNSIVLYRAAKRTRFFSFSYLEKGMFDPAQLKTSHTLTDFSTYIYSSLIFRDSLLCTSDDVDRVERPKVILSRYSGIRRSRPLL